MTVEELRLPEGITEKDGWLWDENNNRNSIAYHGSKEQALKAMQSLKNCYGCINCSNCSRCSRCFSCSYCSDCSYCANCSDCSYCFICSGCFGCSRCSRCSGKKHYIDGKPFDPTIIPAVTDLHAKVYASAKKDSALNMRQWDEKCGTTMCRGGWIVHHAGEAGYALKDKTSYAFAAMMIAKASGAPISPTRFYDNNEDALADMKRRAKL